MKKLFVILLCIAVMVVAVSAFAGISSTKHNLTTGSSNTTEADGVDFVNPLDANDTMSITVCSFCHIPHGGNTAITGAPIWSRSLPSSASYTLYGGGSTIGSPAGVNNPGALSLTCLSCHDGTISLGTITKNGDALSVDMIGNVDGSFRLVDDDTATSYNPLIGTDLRNDHPVGIIYDSNVTIAGLSTTVGAGDLVVNTYPIFGGGDGTGVVECASCHDPHTSTIVKFLRGQPAAICTDCHSAK